MSNLFRRIPGRGLLILGIALAAWAIASIVGPIIMILIDAPTRPPGWVFPAGSGFLLVLYGACVSLVAWNAKRRGKDVRKRVAIVSVIALFLLIAQTPAIGVIGGVALLILGIWLASAFLVAWVASQKGRSFTNWLLIGIVFGIFALIALAALPNVEDPTVRTIDTD